MNSMYYKYVVVSSDNYQWLDQTQTPSTLPVCTGIQGLAYIPSFYPISKLFFRLNKKCCNCDFLEKNYRKTPRFQEVAKDEMGLCLYIKILSQRLFKNWPVRQCKFLFIFLLLWKTVKRLFCQLILHIPKSFNLLKVGLRLTVFLSPLPKE